MRGNDLAALIAGLGLMVPSTNRLSPGLLGKGSGRPKGNSPTSPREPDDQDLARLSAAQDKRERKAALRRPHST